MAQPVPEKYLDLFQKPAFANLATLMPDGSPQVTPMWVDYDGRHILFNTALGRVKDKNMRRDRRVSLNIIDPADPYRYLEVRGKVVDVTQEGADQHIDKLAQKYLNVAKYPFRQPGEQRVIFRIEPERICESLRARRDAAAAKK